ncbi:hypothetical protein CZ797_05810 [Pseudoalteromonas sp. JB197]|nr:hypothetical protein CZ797_05810 [Pseudoalteromonas sp. JB197]
MCRIHKFIQRPHYHYNKLLNYQDRITWFLFQKSIIIFNYPYLLSLLTVKARLILSI